MMAIALLICQQSVSAELVMLSSGRTLKASAVEVEGAVVRIELGSDATMEVPLESVERILDDEIIEERGAEVVAIERGFRYDPSRKPLFDSVWSEWIVHFAHEFDVDASLISAVIKAESDFDPTVVSHKGATGLMQLMPATATRFGVDDPRDPVQNMRAGVEYLAWLLDRFDGSVELALAGYNAGEGNVKKYGGVPPFRETRDYIRKISGYLGG